MRKVKAGLIQITVDPPRPATDHAIAGDVSLSFCQRRERLFAHPTRPQSLHVPPAGPVRRGRPTDVATIRRGGIGPLCLVQYLRWRQRRGHPRRPLLGRWSCLSHQQQSCERNGFQHIRFLYMGERSTAKHCCGVRLPRVQLRPAPARSGLFLWRSHYPIARAFSFSGIWSGQGHCSVSFAFMSAAYWAAASIVGNVPRQYSRRNTSKVGP